MAGLSGGAPASPGAAVAREERRACFRHAVDRNDPTTIIVVENVARPSGRLVGYDPYRRARVTMPTCAGLRVTGKASFAQIRRGDVVVATNVVGPGGTPAAAALAVNLFVANAILGHRSAGKIGLSIRGYHSAASFSVATYPSYYGKIATSGIIESNAVITAGGGRVGPGALTPGRLAKIYGYKAPGSSVVRIYRLEIMNRLQRPARSSSTARASTAVVHLNDLQPAAAEPERVPLRAHRLGRSAVFVAERLHIGAT